ncbi:MAG: DUF937 domain-containing protein [Acidobacteriota bacterium]|jgi:hypothetical protein|nr:MAG: hypothetical protein DIU54_06055 [Acidobacteriota bacterium]
MDLLQMILNAQNGQAVDRIGGVLGLQPDQARTAIERLLPALAGGMARNVTQPGGLESLESALTRGNHARYLDDPSQLGGDDSIAEGNGILGHLLGSKDVSRQVASQVSAETGIGADVLKKMLPMLASVVMAALARNASRSSTGQVQFGQDGPGGGLFDLLGPLLAGGQGSQPGGLGAAIDMLGGLFRK